MLQEIKNFNDYINTMNQVLSNENCTAEEYNNWVIYYLENKWFFCHMKNENSDRGAYFVNQEFYNLIAANYPIQSHEIIKPFVQYDPNKNVMGFVSPDTIETIKTLINIKPENVSSN